ncbi:hypothetical protein D3C76_725870 [compost metagenome]
MASGVRLSKWKLDPVTSAQFMDALIDTVRCWNAVVPQQQRQCIPIDLLRRSWVAFQGFQFGTKQQAVSLPSVIQRLFAKPVTRKAKRLLQSVPKRNREHANC